jgi:hypothetical protein
LTGPRRGKQASLQTAEAASIEPEVGIQDGGAEESFRLTAHASGPMLLSVVRV